MPDGVSTRERIGAEWVGLARAYRFRVRAVDHRFDAALTTLTLPIRTRLQRHPKLRHELVAGTIRRYRASIPAEFRLGDVTINPDRASFSVVETRLSTSWLTNTAWRDDHREQGVSICTFILALTAGKLSWT